MKTTTRTNTPPRSNSKFRQTQVSSYLVAATLYALPLAASGQTYDIVFNSNRAGNQDIWRMLEDGTGLQQLTSNPADEYCAQPSRDGRLIAYTLVKSGNYSVRLMNADGSNDRLIKDYTSGTGGYPVAWLPEGNAVLIIANPGPGQRLDRLDLDGTQTPFLTASVVGQGSMNYARFSPDGHKLAFSAQVGNWSPTMEIYVADYAAGAVVTGSIQKLTTNSQHDDWMAFSPDGTRMAFSKGVNASGYEPPTNMYTMNSDGSGTPTQIDGSYFTAYCSDWAPKYRILFDGQPTSADPTNIYSMNPDGTGVTKLSNGAYNEGGAKWLPTAISTAVVNEIGTVKLLAGGTLNSIPLDPAHPVITVAPGKPIQGMIPVAAENRMGANAVAPLGGTVDWGERSTAHWMTNQWIATGTHTYNVAVSKTAPAAPGTYHIVVAFSGEFNTAQVFSSTNWSALPGQVSTWNDGNDVGFDWGPEQFATAQRDGALLRHVQFTAASGYLAQHLPAAVVTVRVLPPAHGRVANDIGTVKLLDGGSLNGNAVVPAHPIIRVLPGDPIHGHLVVESNNWMGANAVAPLGGTVDWGARETAHWMTNQWISTGVGTYNVEVDREAPALPGIYHIVVAFSGEYNTAQVFSRTSWASLPGQASTWSDGNDVGFDWGIEEFASARANGSVLTYKQYSPTTFDAQHLPATVVTVQVLPPAAGGQDTDADGQADSDDADDDNDEIPDTTEIANGTDPLLYDSDHDGLTDAEEATLGTNPLDADTDHDGLADGTEVLLYNTNPATKDSDSDGLSDGDEMFIHGTSPLLKDTDGDGFDDKFELDTGYSPISGTSTPEAFSEMITAVEFHFNGAAGKSYTIESSTDLKTWTTVETGIAGTGGMISRFYSVQGIPKRYFRVGREQ